LEKLSKYGMTYLSANGGTWLIGKKKMDILCFY